MQKNFSSKKRCTIFCDNFSLTTCVVKNFFRLFFIHAFLRIKKYRLKKYSSIKIGESIFQILKRSSIYRLPHFLSVK